MYWDHRFKDIVFCIGLTFGILGSLKWRVLRPSDKGYIDYRCRIYGISLAWKWDSWRVLGPSPQGSMALWQPEIDIPVGLENHRRHCTWLLEKHFLAFWLPENAIPYGLKDARRLLATWERMLKNEFWRQEISIHHADELGIWQSLSHCLKFLTCKYMISQGSWHSTEGYVASHEKIWKY